MPDKPKKELPNLNVSPFAWAVLAFVQVLTFTFLIPELKEMGYSEITAENPVYNLWLMLLTATLLRVRTNKSNRGE